jgi:thiamine transport system ATP-binding protein
MLTVADVHVRFDGATVLDGVSLEVAEGEVVGLLGPSGSGKSTLLRVVAGLLDPERGRVLVDGRDITKLPTHLRGVGLVFQDEQLFPHRDVAANVEFGLRMQGRPATERRARVTDLLELVGLTGFGSRRVTELSGGEAKRVALARSLAPAPRVLLLDEPLTGLDRELHDRLMVEVARILRAAGTTSVLVTHDHEEAAAIADRVVTMAELAPAGRSVRELVELAAADTHPLRAAVLRNDTPSRDLVLDGDDEPGTIHLGLRERGELVGVSTWLRRPYAGAPGAVAVQLRAMATARDRQGGGIGGALLEHGVERAFRDGADVVWARARDTALDFYRHHGFEVAGDGFVDETTARPHHVIVRHRPVDRRL